MLVQLLLLLLRERKKHSASQAQAASTRGELPWGYCAGR